MKGASLTDFLEKANKVSSRKATWITSDFMRELGLQLVSENTSDNVAIAYFRLWSLLPKTTTSHRIQATVKGVYDYYMFH